MQVPLQLTFRGMAHSDALTAHVRLRAEKLEHLFDCMIVEWARHQRAQRHDESANRKGS
jgi:hypothetical protein